MKWIYRLAAALLLAVLAWQAWLAWQTRQAAAAAAAAAAEAPPPTFAPAPAPDTTALATLACPMPPAPNPYGMPTTDASTTPPGDPMHYRAPTTSEPLQTLDILRVGLSMDVFRQGQTWARLLQQNTEQPEALHIGLALPMDPRDYPVSSTRQDMAWNQRKYNALELALQGFPERWPLPTIAVVRDYDAQMERPRVPPEDMAKSLNIMVGRAMGPAGLHWHRIRQLDPGVVCRTDPEGLIESIFLFFERNPDLPAMMVYALDGFNMRAALSSKNLPLDDIAPPGVRVPTTPTDAVVALVVGRPERIEWLRWFAPFTRTKPNSIDPAFMGWQSQPRTPFQASPFFAAPLTEPSLQQWDQLKPLARLHRPVSIPLVQPGQGGKPLKHAARHQVLASGWDQATQRLGSPAARVFFDGGEHNGGFVQLAPAMYRAKDPVDLLDSSQSYDLRQRLGDIGAASPFVGIALATMASHLNADSSLVVPLRQPDSVTFIGISSPTPGRKPGYDPFGVSLRPQHAAVTNEPDPEHLAWVARLERQYREMQEKLADPYRDPQVMAREKQLLDDFLAQLPGRPPGTEGH